MATYIQKINQLDPAISKYLVASVGVEFNIQISDKYKLGLDQTGELTKIITEIFLQEQKVGDLVALLKSRVKLTEKKAKDMALEIAGKRLLIVDDYLNNAVSNFIEQLGGKVETYTDFIENYKKETEREISEAKAEEDKEQAEENLPSPIINEEKVEDVKFFDFSKPENVFAQIKDVFEKNLLATLEDSSPEMRTIINSAIITLILETPAYQQELINELAVCQEKVTTAPIIYKNEKVEPTVENWLKDFVSHLVLRQDEQLSTVQKAKYYSENANLKALTPDERERLDRVFDLYENLLNFDQNANRLSPQEMLIFPIAHEEMEEMLKRSVATLPQEEKAKDIYDLYLGDPKEQEDLKLAESAIISQTRKEVNKVADLFYDVTLKRKKIEIIAGLKILAEIGGLDDLVIKDKRFKELLTKHFERNNLPSELAEFKASPADLKFVKYFIKYILMERLGMSENDAARIAARLSGIFRSQGIIELSQLAYFDLPSKQFKWL